MIGNICIYLINLRCKCMYHRRFDNLVCISLKMILNQKVNSEFFLLTIKLHYKYMTVGKAKPVLNTSLKTVFYFENSNSNKMI